MITIDAAIELCENQISFSNEEYMKLAEWLEELKELRVAYYKGFKEGKGIGYNKAIDNMVCSLIKNSTTEEIDGKVCLIVTEKRIKIVAEQLKEGGADE